MATAVSALAIGIPTGVVPTALYHRMTPVTWWDRPIWLVSALLLGLLAATYVRADPVAISATEAGQSLGGGLLSAFAIGCPICNKLVVVFAGTAGTLDYWAPLQPFVGLVSLALLGVALALRLRQQATCMLDSPASG